jgi:hypothetical protein
MKKELINRHLKTRKQIEQAAKKLNISTVGSRESLIIAISNKSYSAIKKAINE